MKNCLRWLFLLVSVCWISGQARAQTVDGCAGFRLSAATYNQAGDIVTIYLRSAGADSLLGLQYTHSWDPTQLEFVSIVENSLRGFNSSSFNTSAEQTSQGKLPMVWIDPTLSFYSPAAEENIYGLRFRVLSTNQVARVGVVGSPTPVEIVRAGFQTLESYWFQDAVIAPVGSSSPVLSAACIEGQRCDQPETGAIYGLSMAEPGAYTYNWTGPSGFSSDQDSLVSLLAGSYGLTITDANAQTAYVRMQVAADLGWDMTIQGTPSVCGTGDNGTASATVSGGSGNYTYLWSNGATTDSVSNLAPGDYGLTVSDLGGGCEISRTFEIGEESAMIVSASISDPSCLGIDDGYIALAVSAPESHLPLNYLWSNGATTDSIAGLSSGMYSLTITANNGCSVVEDYRLQASVGFEVEAVIQPVSCQSNEGGISLLVPGSTDDYSFLWSTGATTASIQNLAPGEYSVTVTALDGGCTLSRTFTLASEELVVGVTYTCQSPTVGQLAALVWSNTAPPYTFAWSTGETTTAEQISSISIPGSGTYAVTVTGSDGCSQAINNILVDCGTVASSDLLLALSPDFTEANNGDVVCMELTASNFQQINSIQFSLDWNPQLLSFLSVDQFGLPGMGSSSFNVLPSLVSTGRMATSWIAPNVDTGVTLADGETLFRICFSVIGSGGVANVNIGEVPTAVEVVNVNNELLEVQFSAAQVAINGNGSSDEVHFYAESVTTNLGEQVCMPIRADGISGVGGMQFSLRWNPENLQYAGVQTAALPNVNLTSNFGLSNESISSGALRFLWADPSFMAFPGLNLPDGSALFNVCFQPLSPGVHTVSFGQAPIMPVVGSFEAEPIPVSTAAGTVTVTNQSAPDVDIRIQSAAAAPGQPACVEVIAERFVDVLSFQFTLNWDDNLVSFEELTAGPHLPQFQALNYSVGSSSIAFSYVAPGLNALSVPAGGVLFTLCFETSATQTGLSPLFVSATPTPVEFIGGNLEELTALFSSGQIAVTEEELVWPGDADNSGLANHFDLLPIGLGQGLNGVARQQMSTYWAAQYSPAWQMNTPESGIDYRHADTNGDGVIDGTDPMAIELNWGSETNFWSGAEEEFRLTTTGTPLYVHTDTVSGGEVVSFPIILGDESSPAQAYGLAFSIVYDPAAVSPGSVSVTAEDSWLGELGNNLILIHRDFVAENRVDVAFTRTDGLAVSGQGSIGEFNITLEDVIFQRGTYEMPVRIENVRLINAEEEEQEVAPRETSALIQDITGATTLDALPELVVSPIPTADWLSVSHPNAHINRIELLGTNGQELASFTDGTRLSLAGYPAGMYWLRIITNKGVALRKVVRQ